MAKENLLDWEELICHPTVDLDPHGADYGLRKLVIPLPDFTSPGTMYIVRYKLVESKEELKQVTSRMDSKKQ